MFCPHCGKPLSEAGAYCPHCGKKTAATTPRKEPPSTAWKTILTVTLGVVVVAFILILAFLVGGLFFGTEKNTGQNTAAPQIPESTNPTQADSGETTATVPPTTEAPLPTLSASNPYYDYFPGADAYIVTDSDSRYLSAADLAHLDHDNLVIVRNEIFARRGYTFGSSELDEYFRCLRWYTPDPGFSSSMFNKYETANIALCDMYERKLEGVKFSSDNPYKPYFAGKNGYVMPHSNKEYLHEGDLYELPKAKAALARNEILARHGYTFEAKHLQEYFLQCSWYKPTTPPGSTAGLSLSKLENTNIEYLKAYEKSLSFQPDLSKLDTSLTFKVSTEAFHVYLPAYWKTYANYKNMEFSLKQSGTNFDAFLFDLKLYADKNEFEDAPAYDLLGTITDASGSSRYLVAMYPTDVQWIFGYQELYTKMYDEIGKIQDTIKANPGYEYTPQ